MKYLITSSVKRLIEEKNNFKNIEATFFLGDWCLHEEDRGFVPNSELIQDFVLNNVEDTIQAQNTCANIFDDCIETLTSTYNQYFGLNKDKIFYTTLLGWWLMHLFTKPMISIFCFQR